MKLLGLTPLLALLGIPASCNKPEGQIERRCVAIQEGQKITFKTDKADISPTSAGLLDATTSIALLCSDYKIAVNGYTDSRGDADYNLALSEGRANTLRDYLLDRGVSESAVETRRFGETQPLITGENRDALEQKLRTEFVIIDG